MSTRKKFHTKSQNFELAVYRYMHPRMTGMHNKQTHRKSLQASKPLNPKEREKFSQKQGSRRAKKPLIIWEAKGRGQGRHFVALGH